MYVHSSKRSWSSLCEKSKNLKGNIFTDLVLWPLSSTSTWLPVGKIGTYNVLFCIKEIPCLPVCHWPFGFLGLSQKLVQSKWIFLCVLFKLHWSVPSGSLVSTRKPSIWLEPGYQVANHINTCIYLCMYMWVIVEMTYNNVTTDVFIWH